MRADTRLLVNQYFALSNEVRFIAARSLLREYAEEARSLPTRWKLKRILGCDDRLTLSNMSNER